MAPLDIGPTDFAAADHRIHNLRRDRARNALTSAIEAFGQQQRAQFERSAVVEEEIGSTVAALVGIGELCVRQAEELQTALKAVDLDTRIPHSLQYLSTLIAESAADASLADGFNVVRAAIELECV